MQLPQFIQRALGFFDKAEANLTAANELAAANAKILSLEGELRADNDEITKKAFANAELQVALEKAQGEVNAKGAAVAKLIADLEAEQKRTEETLAGMGVDPKRIPAKKDEPTNGGGKGSIIEQHDAIKDATVRMEFYRKNRAAYDAEWRAKNP